MITPVTNNEKGYYDKFTKSKMDITSFLHITADPNCVKHPCQEALVKIFNDINQLTIINRLSAIELQNYIHNAHVMVVLYEPDNKNLKQLREHLNLFEESYDRENIFNHCRLNSLEAIIEFVVKNQVRIQ